MGKGIIVEIGNKITIQFSDGQILEVVIFDQFLIQTVHSKELFISKKSPLAQTLLGHQAGQSVKYQVRNMEWEVKILKVSPSRPL